jgi:hypothetical protein
MIEAAGVILTYMGGYGLIVLGCLVVGGILSFVGGLFQEISRLDMSRRADRRLVALFVVCIIGLAVLLLRTP